MKLNARLGYLIPPIDSVWFGTVQAYDTQTFTLTVATINGSLANIKPGYILTTGGDLVRVKSVSVPANQIYVAENEADLAGNAIIVYPVRVPFPRYQKLGGDGAIYKDWNIGWANSPYSQPPAVLISPEAIWCDVGEEVTLNGENSLMVYPASYPDNTVTLSWDAGAGGSVSASGTRNQVVNVDAVVSWNSSGFRYLSVTGTDHNGITQARYIPVWVGITPGDVASATLSWRNNEGWGADFDIYSAPAFVANSPVALVDLDTKEVLFLGYIEKRTISYNFEKGLFKASAASPLAFSRRLYSYPFVLISNDSPTSWNDLAGLTLGRSVYFLLNWHSNLKELCNVRTDPAERIIKTQYFTAGSIYDQLQTLGKSAFWDMRADRGGGFNVALGNLYKDSYWSENLELSGDQIKGEITIQYQDPEVSRARLDGVYYDSTAGKFIPLIVQAPDHPGRVGRPVDVPGLAPISQTELLFWAGRYIAANNNSNGYNFEALSPIDPVSQSLVGLPDGTVISVESIQMNFTAEALYFSQRISGKTQGTAAVPVVIPPPPPVIYPPVTPPPVYPPLPPLPPEELVWPTRVYFGSTLNGVYYTDNFSGPDGLGQPTWNQLNGGLASNKIHRLWVDPFYPAEWQFAHVVDTGINSLYARHGGAWYEILSVSQAYALSGLSGAVEISMEANLNRLNSGQIDVIIYGTFAGARVLKSTNRGGSFALVSSATPPTVANYGIGHLESFGDNLYFVAGYPFGGGLLNRSTDGGNHFSYAEGISGLAGSGAGALAPLSVYGTRDLSADLWLANFSGGSHSKVQDGLDLAADLGDLWISDDYAGWHKILRNEQLLETLDSWATVNYTKNISVAHLGPIDVLYPALIDRPDWLLIGCTAPTLTPTMQPHSIFAYDADFGQIVGRGGASPDVAPYTGSIPYNSGGPCFRGIQSIPEDF